MKPGLRRGVIAAVILGPLLSGPAVAQILPQTPASPSVPSAPGSISARTNPPPQTQTSPTQPASQAQPTPPANSGNAFREELRREQRASEYQQWREAERSASTISCTQDGQEIISVENAYSVRVENGGTWPIINFRQGYAGPARSIGLNSPTLACTTIYGVTQGGFNQQSGSTGGADTYTLTCFRRGAIVAQQRVSNVQMSWSYNKMTMSYHLQDGQETPSSATFDVTTTACLVEPASQELVQVDAQLQ
jgi:hypothetical protein